MKGLKEMNNQSYDKIHIKNLEVFANHGVFAEETVLGQKFLVSAILYTNTRLAGKSDDLSASTNYGEVCTFITSYMKAHTSKLIETVAENLAEALLLKYDKLVGVNIEVKKPWAPVGLPLETVSIEIQRFWHTTYIALGSNMGDKKKYLDDAIEQLRNRHDCKVEKVSSYLVTKPYGNVEQDDFLNACLCLKTLLPSHELLDVLHEIEQLAHRERLIHWGPRTLDLDILLYDNDIIDDEDLIVPHIEMHKRNFVLEPLCEIAPNKRHPILLKTIKELKEANV